MTICPCGGRLQKRITDEGRAFECVSCGRYELSDKRRKGIIDDEQTRKN